MTQSFCGDDELHARKTVFLLRQDHGGNDQTEKIFQRQFHYTTISVPQQLHCAIIPKATVQKYPFGIPSAKRTIKIVKFIDDNLSLAQFLLTQSSGQNDLVGE